MSWLIAIPLAALWGWAIYNQFHSLSKRTKEMQQVASELGLQYLSRETSWSRFVWGDPVPAKGGALNVLTGRHNGWSVVAMDRTWGASYGRGRGSNTYSVSAVALSREFPRLYVHRGTLPSRTRGLGEG